MAVQAFGKYTVTRPLGSGGMAAVYLAHDPMLDRDVAIKVIHPHLASEEGFEQRFLREAKLVASLRHPNIVQLYEFDVRNGQPFMVMEYLSGGTLWDRLEDDHRRGATLPFTEAARLVTAIAAGLDYAHGRGLVHRDLKPGNILFDSNGEPVISDFGIAKILGGTSSTKTTGSIFGTPDYLSPEHAMGKAVDRRSDIYSLGIILYEMVTGRVPFQGETPMAVIMQQLNTPPPPPRSFNPALPDAAQAVILKALAKNPDERFGSAADLARAFSAALAPSATSLSAATLPATPAFVASQVTRQASSIHAAATARVIPAPRRTPLALALGLLGLVVLAVCGFIGLIWFANGRIASFLPFGGSPSATISNQGAMPPIAGTPSAGQDSFGLLRFADGSARADQVVLTLTNLPAPSAGNQYEAWLVGQGGEARQSIGKFKVDAKGQGQLTYVDKDGANLLAQYDRVEITLEPDPDPSPLPSGNVVFSGAVPPGAMTHLRHLLVAFDDTPNHTGFVVGLLQDAQLVNRTTQDMLDGNQHNDFERVLVDAETLVNVIEGKQGEHYGDLDKNAIITDPSDGYGLLINGKNMGYIEGAIDHANLAGASPDATEEIKMHAEHVKIAAKNLDTWAGQLRDLSLKVLGTSNNASSAEFVRQSAALGARFLNGIDIDGDEKVDPVPGEAGALIAYGHAFYMADMSILKGANAMPTPGPK